MVLPAGNNAFSSDLAFEAEPGKTWYIDQHAQRISGECDNEIAVKQAAEIILRTERYKWFIYEPDSGVEYSNLIGRDPGYVAVELQRRIKEALLMDTRIKNVTDYKFEIKGDILSVSFVVRTLFGDFEEEMEVGLND